METFLQKLGAFTASLTGDFVTNFKSLRALLLTRASRAGPSVVARLPTDATAPWPGVPTQLKAYWAYWAGCGLRAWCLERLRLGGVVTCQQQGRSMFDHIRADQHYERYRPAFGQIRQLGTQVQLIQRTSVHPDIF